MAQVISASPQGTIASVSGLKQSLAKELTKLEKYQKDNVALSSAFYERCLDILNELDKLPVDLSVLSKTLIGTVVSKFKKCSDENVSSKAKQLLRNGKISRRRMVLQTLRLKLQSHRSQHNHHRNQAQHQDDYLYQNQHQDEYLYKNQHQHNSLHLLHQNGNHSQTSD